MPISDAALTAGGVDFLKMPKIDPVDVWADKYRFLASERSSMPGRWRTSRTEYMRGLMRAIDDDRYKMVVVVASTQVGKTELIMNWFGRTFQMDAAPCMLVRPNITDARNFGATRLAELIESCPTLTPLFPPIGARAAAGGVAKADLRTFKGGQIDIVGSESATGLASKPIKYLALDEVSRFSRNSGNKEGSAVALAMARLDSFEDAKCLAVSTPTDSSVCQITPLFRSGTMHRYFVPCAGCGHMEPYTFARLNRDEAAMVCSDCGMLNHEDTKADAVANGEWRSTRDTTRSEDLVALDPECFSAHIWAAYSPFVSFEEIVKRHRLAKQNYDEMREFNNLTLGEVFRDSADRLDPEKLRETLETEGEMPDARGLFVSAAADIQDDRIELYIQLVDAAHRCYGLEWVKFPGSTAAHDADAFNALRQFVENYTVELADGRVLAIDTLAVDSGYHTGAVYSWVRSMELGGKVNTIAIKGSRSVTDRIASRRVKITKQEDAPLYLHWVGVHQGKNRTFLSLGLQSDEPGSYYFPPKFGADWWRSVASEERREEFTRGSRKIVWKKTRRHNEGLDLLVYSYAALLFTRNIKRVLKVREEKRKAYAQTVEATTALANNKDKRPGREKPKGAEAADAPEMSEDEIAARSRAAENARPLPHQKPKAGFSGKPSRKSRRQQLFGD